MKRPPGRPPLDASDPSVKLTVTLPSRHLDALIVQSMRERRPFADYLRALLKPPQPQKNTLK